MGTHRGDVDAVTDADYEAAILDALAGGINLIDTSLNYRLQRSERNISTAIRAYVGERPERRSDFVICTKGGFLIPDAVDPATLNAGEIAQGVHCLAPAFLADQIARSRRNLGLATIDVYYLHNPEVQRGEFGERLFRQRLRAAFERLEQAVHDDLIRYYGAATWDGFWSGALSLDELIWWATDVAGPNHHFRFVQLPWHLGMFDSGALNHMDEVLGAAKDASVTVIVSACTWQGRLTRDLPPELAACIPGLDTDAQRAVQFARSTEGVTSALVGMRRRSHVSENLVVAGRPPLTVAGHRRACAALS
jgi:aryl-alcohol dehydrogenase-like predicted oxidoreductase